MSIYVKDVCKEIEELAPRHLAEGWDNVGLVVGRFEQKVNKIMVALDATPDVIREAVKNQVDMIVTHHPLPFKPVKKINSESVLGNQLLDLIENKIALYSAHTNLDVVKGGTNDLCAERIGLKDIKILHPTGFEDLKKVVVFVPKEQAELVRDAMCEASAGHIGNYSHCTYNVEGIGTFMPLEGTNPYIGQSNQLEKVQEIRIETIVEGKNLLQVIEAMKKAHPYEEVAYDIYPLELKGEAKGLGRFGYLENPMTLKEFAKEVKEKLELPSLQFVGDPNKKVKKVALCTGSGMDFAKAARRIGADVYITGDMTYHIAMDTMYDGMALINASHYGTEILILPVLKEHLDKKFMKDVEVSIAKNHQELFTVI